MIMAMIQAPVVGNLYRPESVLRDGSLSKLSRVSGVKHTMGHAKPETQNPEPQALNS